MTHERFADKIAFDLNGTLAADERATLQEHLRECAECRELRIDALLARELALGDPVRLDDHVQAQHLDRLVLAPRELDGAHRRRIERHLAACAACAAARDELRSQVRDDRTAGAPSLRVWWSLFLGPVPAAVWLLLLVTIVPWLLFRSGAPSPPALSAIGADAGAAVDLPVLRAPLRTGSAETEVELTPGTRPALLALELSEEVLRETGALLVSFRSAEATDSFEIEVDAARIEFARDEAGLVVLAIPAGRLSPGRWNVEMRLAREPGSVPLSRWELLVR